MSSRVLFSVILKFVIAFLISCVIFKITFLLSMRVYMTKNGVAQTNNANIILYKSMEWELYKPVDYLVILPFREEEKIFYMAGSNVSNVHVLVFDKNDMKIYSLVNGALLVDSSQIYRSQLAQLINSYKNIYICLLLTKELEAYSNRNSSIFIPTSKMKDVKYLVLDVDLNFIGHYTRNFFKSPLEEYKDLHISLFMTGVIINKFRLPVLPYLYDSAEKKKHFFMV